MERIKASQNLRKKKAFQAICSFPQSPENVWEDLSCIISYGLIEFFLSNFHVLVHRGNKAVSVIEQDTPVVLKIPPVTSSGQQISVDISRLISLQACFCSFSVTLPAVMDRTLVVALFFCVLAVCLATNDQNSDKNSGEPGAKLSMKKRGKEDEDDAKVEVVQDEKDESAKERKASDGLATEKKDIANEKVHGGTKKNEGHDETKDDDEDHDDEEHDDEDDEEEDEEHEEEEEEEVDPNAKIEIHDLFTPEDCKNKSKSGDLVVIHYSGWLDDGKLFDTTVEPSKAYMPFEFMLGTGTVIKGFEQGVLNMCKGQKRKIVIPPSLGYGKKGAGAIPGETEFVYPRTPEKCLFA